MILSFRHHPNPRKFLFSLSAMAEGLVSLHVAQQTRREKLRSVGIVNNLHEFANLIDPTFDSLLLSSDFVPYASASGQDFDRQTFSDSLAGLTQTCKSNPVCAMGLVGGIKNSSLLSFPHLHYPQQLPHSPKPFSHGYNGDGEVTVFKPETLSLSLSSHRHQQKYKSESYLSGVNGSTSNDESRSSVPLSPFADYSLILKGSKFLKPAQLLLEEFCDVLGQTGRIHAEKTMADSSLPDPRHESFKAGVDGSKFGKERSRFIFILDEVYSRYKQYYGQMQEVMTSFEYISGHDNAAPYASLAIKAMSKQFENLKNTIISQLHLTNKPSVHNYSTPMINSGFFDHQPVWRPQRGLPDRAVSVLKSWLFDNFLHPYPTDTDKHMLAKQTGLSRNQVSNWFINARVRLWKPMVEEIYTLESRQPPKAGRISTDLRPSTRHRSEARNPLMKKSQTHFSSRPSPHVAGSNISRPSSISLTLGLHQNNSRLAFPNNGCQNVGNVLAANGEDRWF